MESREVDGELAWTLAELNQRSYGPNAGYDGKDDGRVGRPPDGIAAEQGSERLPTPAGFLPPDWRAGSEFGNDLVEVPSPS